MKIGYDGRFIRADPSGNGVFTRCLLEHLTKLDQRNEYRAYLAHDCTIRPSDNLHLRHMPRIHRNPYCRHLVTFPLETRLFPVDVFHAFYSVPRWIKARVVLTLVECFWFTNPERLPLSHLRQMQFRAMTRYAVQRADAVIVPTGVVKERVVEHCSCPEEKLVVIPLGVHDDFVLQSTDRGTEDIRSRYGIRDGYLLAVGDLHKRKNLSTLIDVFQNVKGRLGSQGVSQLVIVGKQFGRDRSVMDTITRSPVQDDIVLTGYVPIEHLRSLYREAAVLVLPSLDEGFGLTALEAMACGTPVACSNRGSIPEVVGDAALLFEPDNGHAISQAVMRLLTERDLRHRLVEKGRERVKAYSWDAIARQVMDVYASVS